MNYIKCLRHIYAHAIPQIEDIYDECKFENSELSLNELIVQFHFNHLQEMGKLNAKIMFRNLPEKFHWIAKKFIKHEICKIPLVRWGEANKTLKDALTWNWENDEEVLDYIQEHSPVRRSVCV
jgi:hypothetical protein